MGSSLHFRAAWQGLTPAPVWAWGTGAQLFTAHSLVATAASGWGCLRVSLDTQLHASAQTCPAAPGGSSGVDWLGFASASV